MRESVEQQQQFLVHVKLLTVKKTKYGNGKKFNIYVRVQSVEGLF